MLEVLRYSAGGVVRELLSYSWKEGAGRRSRKEGAGGRKLEGECWRYSAGGGS